MRCWSPNLASPYMQSLGRVREYLQAAVECTFFPAPIQTPQAACTLHLRTDSSPVALLMSFPCMKDFTSWKTALYTSYVRSAEAGGGQEGSSQAGRPEDPNIRCQVLTKSSKWAMGCQARPISRGMPSQAPCCSQEDAAPMQVLIKSKTIVSWLTNVAVTCPRQCHCCYLMLMISKLSSG